VTFVGPFGVGKTTAVVTVSDTSVATTDVASTAMRLRAGRHLKATTTVGLEIGDWTAPDGRLVSVVGTPGQERFDDVRRSAMPRSTAVVLWLFGHHQHAVLDAGLWLNFIAEDVPHDRLAVAVTRLCDAPDGRLDEIRSVLHRVDATIPVMAADPRDRDHVAAVLDAALTSALDRRPVRA
jgi:signal recognition particle receptor subunit beta